jgi:predicted dehydrogenase
MLHKKKAAIIGFGGMGQRHYKAYQKIGVEVTAICDLDRNKIQELLPDFPERHIYDNYDDVLANEEVDILSVVTNGPTHAEVTIRASEAGVSNILCEKPIATNLNDAQQVVDICKENDTRLAVNHIRRWSPTYMRIKKMIQGGIIGDLRHLYFNCGNTGLGNFAIHFFDTARYLTDSEPEWALGFIDKTRTQNPRGKQFIDPGGYGIVHFQNGARFYVDSSEDTGVQYTFQLVGTYGRIIIDELNEVWQIRAREPTLRGVPLTRYGTDMPIVPFSNSTPFDIVELTSRAQSELLSGASISSPGAAGVKSLELVIAFHVSDEQGNSKVTLPLAGHARNKEVVIG